MSPMRLIVLGAALLAAVFAFIGLRGLTPSTPTTTPVVVQAPAPEAIPTVGVLTVARDLAMGDRLTEEDLVWSDWPEVALAERYITEPDPSADAETDELGEDAIDPKTSLIGAVVRSEFTAGEPVLRHKLVLATDGGFMAALVGEGLRAVATPVSVETAAGGFIVPNDRVDVILTQTVVTLNEQGEVTSERTETNTLLRNVRVLAMDQIFRETEDGETTDVVLASTATLELTPAQAESISQANNVGELALALRGIRDVGGAPALNGAEDTGQVLAGLGVIAIHSFGQSREVQTR
ncbi:MAG: Flp pilus assembly protein CpaB [Maricaulaceae bacterium]